MRLIGAGKTAELLKVVAHCLRAKIVPSNGGPNEQDILDDSSTTTTTTTTKKKKKKKKKNTVEKVAGLTKLSIDRDVNCARLPVLVTSASRKYDPLLV